MSSNKLAMAYHEAGHAVVAVHFGLFVPRCAIWRTSSEGRAFSHCWDGACNAGHRLSLSDQQQRVEGIAGSVAMGIGEDEEWCDSLMDVSEGMSPSDWHVNGVQEIFATMSNANEWQWIRAMREAHKLLTGPLHDELGRVVRKLMRHRFISLGHEHLFKMRREHARLREEAA